MLGSLGGRSKKIQSRTSALSFNPTGQVSCSEERAHYGSKNRREDPERKPQEQAAERLSTRRTTPKIMDNRLKILEGDRQTKTLEKQNVKQGRILKEQELKEEKKRNETEAKLRADSLREKQKQQVLAAKERLQELAVNATVEQTTPRLKEFEGTHDDSSIFITIEDRVLEDNFVKRPGHAEKSALSPSRYNGWQTSRTEVLPCDKIEHTLKTNDNLVVQVIAERPRDTYEGKSIAVRGHPITHANRPCNTVMRPKPKGHVAIPKTKSHSLPNQSRMVMNRIIVKRKSLPRRGAPPALKLPGFAAQPVEMVVRRVSSQQEPAGDHPSKPQPPSTQSTKSLQLLCSRAATPRRRYAKRRAPQEVAKIENFDPLHLLRAILNSPKMDKMGICQHQPVPKANLNIFKATEPQCSPHNNMVALQIHDNILASETNNQAVSEVPDDTIKEDAWAEIISLMLQTSMVELEYSISKELVQIAMKKNSGNPTYFSYDLFRNVKGEKLPLHYCKSFQASEKVAAMFLDEKLLGFDLEWNSRVRAGNTSIKDNVSVVQVASPTRIAIFQLAMHKGDTAETILPPSLRKIVESENIIKTGVSIHGDCSRFEKFLGVKAKGLIELSHLHNLVTDRFNKGSADGKSLAISKTPFALHKQVHAHLYLPLFKGEVRTSKWHQELRSDQCSYAATDAWAAVCLFYELERKRLDMDPMPPRPEFAELGLPVIGAQKTQSELIKDTEETESSDEDDVWLSGVSLEKDVESETLSDTSADWDSKAISSAEELSSQLDSISLNTPFTDEPSSSKIAAASRHKKSSSSSQNQGEILSELPSSLSTLSDATRWITKYTASIVPTRALRVGNHKLHAYTLWYHQRANLGSVATSLDRKSRPALVATYILDTIELERLPYDAERVSELLKLVPVGKRRKYEDVLATITNEKRKTKA